MYLRPAWSTSCVLGHPGLHSETLSKTKKTMTKRVGESSLEDVWGCYTEKLSLKKQTKPKSAGEVSFLSGMYKMILGSIPSPTKGKTKTKQEKTLSVPEQHKSQLSKQVAPSYLTLQMAGRRGCPSRRGSVLGEIPLK